jgi:hypothetical protein
MWNNKLWICISLTLIPVSKAFPPTSYFSDHHNCNGAKPSHRFTFPFPSNSQFHHSNYRAQDRSLSGRWQSKQLHYFPTLIYWLSLHFDDLSLKDLYVPFYTRHNNTFYFSHSQKINHKTQKPKAKEETNHRKPAAQSSSSSAPLNFRWSDRTSNAMAPRPQIFPFSAGCKVNNIRVD